MSRKKKYDPVDYFVSLKKTIEKECAEPEIILPYLKEIENELGEEELLESLELIGESGEF